MTRVVLVPSAVASVALACASGATERHRSLQGLWRQYLELPEERALAIAGDPERNRWVAGASSGHESPAEAEDGALAECRRRRQKRRLQAACLLYAVGDEIVWNSR